MDKGIKNILDNKEIKNIFDLGGLKFDEEIFESLFENEKIKIERIVSSGQSTPPGEWYDQTAFEWVILLSGEAELAFEDNTRRTLTPGEFVLLPPHCRHRVESTSKTDKTVWLAVHF